MSEVQYQSVPSLSRTEQNTRSGSKSVRGMIVGWSAAVLIWGGLAYGGYTLANQYISETNGKIQQLNQELQTMKATNQSGMEQLGEQLLTFRNEVEGKISEQTGQMRELHGQLTSIGKEMAVVQEQLALAGDSLTSSDETRQTLSKRITELNKKLAELQQSIQKLEEAARVY